MSARARIFDRFVAGGDVLDVEHRAAVRGDNLGNKLCVHNLADSLYTPRFRREHTEKTMSTKKPGSPQRE